MTEDDDAPYFGLAEVKVQGQPMPYDRAPPDGGEPMPKRPASTIHALAEYLEEVIARDGYFEIGAEDSKVLLAFIRKWDGA